MDEMSIPVSDIGTPTILQSMDVSEIMPALVLAQGEASGVVADGKNPVFQSLYVPLPAVLLVLKPIMAKHGLALIHSMGVGVNKSLLAVARLYHSSGQWIEITIPMRASDRGDMNQALGSVMTYARRYTACALFQLPQVDDDANFADKKGPDPEVNLQDTVSLAEIKKDSTVKNAIDNLKKLSQAKGVKFTPSRVTKILKPCTTVKQALNVCRDEYRVIKNEGQVFND